MIRLNNKGTRTLLLTDILRTYFTPFSSVLYRWVWARIIRQWKIFFSRQIHVVWNKSKRIRMGSNSEKYQVFRSFCSLNFTKTDNLRRIREISEISGIAPFSYCDQNIPESFDFFRCERQSIESNLLTVNTGIDFNGYF